MHQTLLEVLDLSVVGRGADGNDQKLIQDLGFSVDVGQTIGIVGESGSGKSLLASTIMHILAPGCRVDKGQILFEGQDIHRLSKKNLNRIRGFQIAMISDNPLEILDPICSVEKQVRETIRAYNPEMSKARAVEMGLSIFKTLKMPDPEKMMHSYPYQLSGGMQQRVAIALALCGDVKLLIADDAVRSLDVTVAAQIIEILRKMKVESRLSLVWISNSLPVCSLLADNIMIMYNGRILEIGPKARILNDPRHFYTQKLVQVTPSLTVQARDTAIKDLKLKSGLSILNKRNGGCEFSNICQRSDTACEVMTPVLSDVDQAHQCRCHHI